MTQEEKELLLKDLCSRLPYGVICHFKYGSAEGDITLDCIDKNVARFEYGWHGRFHVIIDSNYIKPYLRPMSSMTEEERKKWDEITDMMGGFMDVDDIEVGIDWLNSRHFDYRGLIEKGLALEVTKENNPYEA